MKQRTMLKVRTTEMGPAFSYWKASVIRYWSKTPQTLMPARESQVPVVVGSVHLLAAVR